MIIQTKKAKQGLPIGHIVMGRIVKVTTDPVDGVPEDCLLHWQQPTWKTPIIQRLPASLEGNSPLARVVAIIRHKALTPEEVQAGYDTEELVGGEAPIFLTTKAGAGGKLAPAIGEVHDLATIKADVAALPDPTQAVQPPAQAPAVELNQSPSEATASE
jgi:hypothetical protein